MPVLRPMRPEDLEALLVVQREGAVAGLGHIFPQETHPFPTAVIRARWESEIADPETRCWVVERDGAIAGFVAARGAELLHFGTALSTWGSGLAGLAHDEAVAAIRGAGHDVPWLKVLVENERAIRFYRRRAWTPTGRLSASAFPPHPVYERFEWVGHRTAGREGRQRRSADSGGGSDAGADAGAPPGSGGDTRG